MKTATDTSRPSTGDVAGELARLLPELAVALYESAPHPARGARSSSTARLTGRQLEAVVFLSHHRRVTMSEFAAGLEISPAAASELVARLIEKGVARREADPDDRRVVLVRLAGAAERYAESTHREWQRHIDVVFQRHPAIDSGTLIAFLTDLTSELKGSSRP
ncbi:MAG: MarR family transcriptional regulator [Actinobacteria bacterium]|nr:MarR family transcriptional regulator [Actinomycetota bacterium]